MKMGHIEKLGMTSAAVTGSLFLQLHAIEADASLHQSDASYEHTKQGSVSFLFAKIHPCFFGYLIRLNLTV